MSVNRLSKLLRVLIFMLSVFVFANFNIAAKEKQSGGYVNLNTESGQEFTAYVAGSKNARRGILLIHGWLGLNRDIKMQANHFAAQGYQAMAVDLYDGRTASNPEDAKRLMDSVNQNEADAKYASALKALFAPGRKIAVIGWSYGGSQAMHASLSAPELVSATVCYYPYGEMVTDTSSLKLLKSPILVQVGDKDFAFTPEKVRQFKSAVREAGKTLEINVYHAKHAFDKENSQNYDKTISDKAYLATNEFLDKYME